MSEPNRLLRPALAAEYLGVSTTTLWRLSKQDGFPKKVRIGARAVGYWKDELRLYADGLMPSEQEAA